MNKKRWIILMVCAALLIAALILFVVRPGKGELLLEGRGFALSAEEFSSYLRDRGIDEQKLTESQRSEIIRGWLRSRLILLESSNMGLEKGSASYRSIEQKVEDYRENLVVAEAIRQYVQKEITVTDDEVNRYYQNRKEEEYRAEEGMAWLVVIFTRNEEEALKAMKSVNDQKMDPAAFHSEKETSGFSDLGYLPFNDLGDDIREDILAAPAGRALRPVRYEEEGRTFYYVFVVRDKVWKNDFLKREAVAGQIREAIRKIKGKEALEELLKHLLVKYRVKGFEGTL
ncbi:MAG TPA: hypothetical protein PLL34_04500 [Candidatus Mcinerneyibacteriales bacterium]|nr:hypothetical protein [Candidatus Mcinerneyibacteriales bacterium]HPE20834.1 hypothetical protein [Candidatus Mcinerneyibacteriales bacterium]HPQ89979.1 hypothetical protein [Candidatus Mcinerneyibacteriales bacterium]